MFSSGVKAFRFKLRGLNIHSPLVSCTIIDGPASPGMPSTASSISRSCSAPVSAFTCMHSTCSRLPVSNLCPAQVNFDCQQLNFSNTQVSGFVLRTKMVEKDHLSLLMNRIGMVVHFCFKPKRHHILGPSTTVRSQSKQITNTSLTLPETKRLCLGHEKEPGISTNVIVPSYVGTH